jgi:hypothetical protein
MFTLLPSLYFIGVHYFRQWNTSSPSEENQTKVIEKLSKQKIKTRRKKSNYRRRKTSISELSHDEIVYLIKETGFTQEEILAWYDDFLVCINTFSKIRSRLFDFL